MRRVGPGRVPFKVKIPRAIESIATEAASRVRTTSSRPPEELTLLGTLIAKLKLQGKRGEKAAM